MGAFVVQATSNPIEEKQVISFVFDVGLVTLPVILADQINTNMANSEVLNPMTILNKGRPGLLTVYYGSKKIRYDTTMFNGSNTVYRDAITVGDHIPIAA